MEQRSWKDDLQPYLPQRIVQMLAAIESAAPLEEIRVRAGKPLQLCFTGYERLIYAAGGRPAASAEDCAEMLSRVCERSLYAWEEELRQGFITLPGGYRVGVCGRAIGSGGAIERMTDVTSLNFRISRAVPGAATPVLPYLADGDGLPYSTLVLSSPGCGKTTLLRDLARQCACGGPGIRPCRVAVVDARYELAGCIRGVPQFDLGPRTDVLSGCSKADGMRLMVTTMSPQVLVADELSSGQDVSAAQEAAACGVPVLTTLHAATGCEVCLRTGIEDLLAEGIFEQVIFVRERRVTCVLPAAEVLKQGCCGQ